MFRTQKTILLLPLASLVIYTLAAGLAFIVAELLNRDGWDSFDYVFALYAFCSICSVSCGTFAVTRKAVRFPKRAWFARILPLLSILFLIYGISIFVFSFPQNDATGEFFEGFVAIIGQFCFISFLTSLFVIIREAVRKAQDFHTGVIFSTQLMWIFLRLFPVCL